MKIRCLFVVILCFATQVSAKLPSQPVTSQAVSLPAIQAQPTPARIADLDQRYVSGIYHVYYTNEGHNAFGRSGSAEDGARKVKVLADQLERGQRFYQDEIGLEFLLGRGRFSDISHIDVRVANFPKIMGSAEAGRFTLNRNKRFYPTNHPAKTSLQINISTRWHEGNLTPEHEVFHLYQYGYSFIANIWYLEGLAGSLAPAFRENARHVYRSMKLPQTKIELHDLLTAQTHHLSGAFWNRLMANCEDACPIDWKGEDFSVRQGQMCSKKFVRAFMENLQENEKKLVQFRGGQHYDGWRRPKQVPSDQPQTERRRYENNFWLLGSVSQAMESACQYRGKPELETFKKMIDSMGKNENEFVHNMDAALPISKVANMPTSVVVPPKLKIKNSFAIDRSP